MRREMKAVRNCSGRCASAHQSPQMDVVVNGKVSKRFRGRKVLKYFEVLANTRNLVVNDLG